MCCHYIPYGWKLSRVKTFTNFAALLPSAKFFSINFVHMHGSAGIHSGQFANIFSAKCYIFTNSQKFSPAKVLYGVY